MELNLFCRTVKFIQISITISFVSSFRNGINTLYYLPLSSFYKISKLTTLKHRVYKFYSENILEGEAFTWHSFEIERAKRATVYKYMKCVDNNKPIELTYFILIPNTYLTWSYKFSLCFKCWELVSRRQQHTICGKMWQSTQLYLVIYGNWFGRKFSSIMNHI